MKYVCCDGYIWNGTLNKCIGLYFLNINSESWNFYAENNLLKTTTKYLHFKSASKDFMDGTVVTVAPFLLMVRTVNSYAKTVVLTYAIMLMDVLLQNLVNIKSMSMYIFPFRFISHKFHFRLITIKIYSFNYWLK